MANIVYIACSLDGFIARKDGSIDWLMETPNPENSDYGFSAFMDRIDGIIMGRSTFETVLSFEQWPYTKPVYVLSHTLKEVPPRLRDKAEVVQGDLQDIIASLNSKGIKHLYIDGGKTVQSFLKLDMIDELIITRIPIILGSGIPLFADMDREVKFELTQTEILNKDLVKSTYSRKA
jgi:dihydrofolate reductase